MLSKNHRIDKLWPSHHKSASRFLFYSLPVFSFFVVIIHFLLRLLFSVKKSFSIRQFCEFVNHAVCMNSIGHFYYIINLAYHSRIGQTETESLSVAPKFNRKIRIREEKDENGLRK